MDIHMHITLSTSSKKYFMDDLGKYCDEKIIQSLRSGRDGKKNGDNLDFRVATHEIRMNVKAKDFSLLQTLPQTE